jgi:hypothetical protein
VNKLISVFLSLSVAIFIATPSFSADPLPPGYVPPNLNQFNSDGMLAFTPDGRPLAGFNSDGSVNRNLVPPTDPTGIPGGTKLPLTPEASPTPTTIGSPTSGCLDLGVAYRGTGYEVNFGTACGATEISKMWKVIADYAAWVSTQPNQQPSPKPSIPAQSSPFPTPSTTATSTECVDLGTVFKNTQYEVKFGQACGKAEKEKMWSVIADYSAWVSTQPPVVITDPKDNYPAEIKSVSQTAITQVSGKQINIKTGFNLPSVITDTTLKAEIDKQITESTIKAVKTSGGYLLDASKEISAIDTSLKFVATKGRAKPINLVLTADKQGEMLIKTSQNLKGYTIQIKRGSTVLKSVAITK